MIMKKGMKDMAMDIMVAAKFKTLIIIVNYQSIN